jgi:hypothetical protein
MNVSTGFWLSFPFPEKTLFTRKNAQVDAILMKTGLNNVLLSTLFIAVNNIEQYCYNRFRLNNIVQYCWQVWTTWAAKHCSVLSKVLLSSGLGDFCRVLIFTFVALTSSNIQKLLNSLIWKVVEALLMSGVDLTCIGVQGCEPHIVLSTTP